MIVSANVARPLGPRVDATTQAALEPAAGYSALQRRLLDYYNAVTPDYRVWSKAFNMHFGYWRPGLNPLRREPMLHELNLQALARLDLPRGRPAALADLGGGTGATARAAVDAYPALTVDVVTLVPLQVELGHAANAHTPRGDAIAMHCADYTETGLPDGRHDAVCMIESACHAAGPTKAALLREAFRLLRPGGRLVIVDAMLRREVGLRSWLERVMAAVYRRWCVSWAVPGMCRLDLLPDALAAEGFADVGVADWSWRIAPSVAHVPWLATRFMVAELVKSRGVLPAWRWRHVVASLLTPLLGLSPGMIAYVAVTARKPSP